MKIRNLAELGKLSTDEKGAGRSCQQTVGLGKASGTTAPKGF